ncbi:acyl-CoA N-acyltransferase [Mycena rosella]|uniref:N-alpha-acetyltransferase 60 n=1 Tax=Mycena rosella TaxID=1033263 RepID=A0AAD7DG58_MYCRO|nr:acyl-CoA N-acyltransferase [Mycena rosella]
MAEKFALRPMHSHDIPAVLELHAILLPVSYSPSFFLHLLIQPTRICLIAAHEHSNRDSRPVAFISAVVHPEQRIEILTLGVLPTFRQHRLATRLVYAAIDALTGAMPATVDVFAQVSASNVPATSFYKHMGLHPSTVVIRDMFRTLPCGSRDAYIVSGRIQPPDGPDK